jgi:hypothetical protein
MAGGTAHAFAIRRRLISPTDVVYIS